MLNKTSFSIGGYWYHLTLVRNTTWKDQHGLTWFKAGSKFISEGGGLVHDEPKKDTRSNDEYFMDMRESRFAYHRNRMIINKNY